MWHWAGPDSDTVRSGPDFREDAMQITETLAEGLKREYQITITGADLDARVTEKLAEAQPEVAMKGFRKGKVPMALLRKQFGPRLMGEAMQEAVDGAMQGHLDDSGDRPAMQPEVKMVNEDWKEGDDIVVSMVYEKLPEIPEIDYKSIKLEKLVAKPADAEIDEALKNLAESAQNFDTKKGKAADGDQVVIDFVGKVDGEAFEGWLGRGLPARAGLRQLHPRLRGPADRREEGRGKGRRGLFPRGIRRRAPGRKGRGLRRDRERGEKSPSRPRSMTSWPRNTAPKASRR